MPSTATNTGTHKQKAAGTQRSRSPEATMRDFGRHMRTAGITRLANITHLDNVGIPVVVAVRPNSRSLAVSQGKGTDLVSAQVSAMMEALELWHAEHIQRPLRCESYSALAREGTVLDLERLPRAAGGVLRAGVERIWIEGNELLSHEPIWVPYECVSMNGVTDAPGQQTFSCTSNGLASGNILLEGTLHALYELIERDAFALWLAGDKAGSTRVANETIHAPELRAMLGAFDAAAIDVAVFELTSDLRIPTYSCIIVDRAEREQWRRLGMYGGSGCHLSPVVAMSRALTEAAQSRLTYIAGSRDDLLPNVYGDEHGIEFVARQRKRLFSIVPDIEFSGATRETDTFEGDLEIVVGELRAAKVDRVAVIDLTRSDIGIPVVKVLAPGLEGSPHAADYVRGPRALAVAKGDAA